MEIQQKYFDQNFDLNRKIKILVLHLEQIIARIVYFHESCCDDEEASILNTGKVFVDISKYNPIYKNSLRIDIELRRFTGYVRQAWVDRVCMKARQLHGAVIRKKLRKALE